MCFYQFLCSDLPVFFLVEERGPSARVFSYVRSKVPVYFYSVSFASCFITLPSNSSHCIYNFCQCASLLSADTSDLSVLRHLMWSFVLRDITGSGTVMYQVKPLLVQSAFHSRVPVLVQTALLLIRLPAKVPGKTVEHDPGAWAPATSVGDQDV